MMKFLRNAILLCLTAFPHNYILEEAALVAEELYVTKMNSCSCSVTPCRALAKSLLKNDRQVVNVFILFMTVHILHLPDKIFFCSFFYFHFRWGYDDHKATG